MTATGVGAGDLIAASVAGAQFGLALLWAVPVGIVLKFVLSEAVARWQLATGTTLFEGWGRLGKSIQVGFLVYLTMFSNCTSKLEFSRQTRVRIRQRDLTVRISGHGVASAS